jgi:hypothetical protein
MLHYFQQKGLKVRAQGWVPEIPITTHGIQPIANKICAVIVLDVPKSQRKLRQFCRNIIETCGLDNLMFMLH